MNEIEWLALRDKWKRQIQASKNIIAIGFLLLGVGVWFLPAWWMKLVGFGIWLMFFGGFAYTGLQRDKLDENFDTDFIDKYKEKNNG